MENLPDLKTLTSDERNTLIVALYELGCALCLTIKQQVEHIEIVKEYLSKNSQNTSKPVFDDGLSKPALQIFKNFSSKNSADQKRHKSYALKAVASTAVFPPEMIAVLQYGTCFNTVVVYFSQYQFILSSRGEEMPELLYGISWCAGSLYNSNFHFYQALESEKKQIKAALKPSLIHADESGIRAEGNHYWLDSIGTAQLFSYQHYEKRSRKKQTQAKRLLDHVQNFKTETLCFLTDLVVPFDNNFVEPDIRMVKLKHKISAIFQSDQSASLFFWIYSYLSFAKKDHNRLNTLTLSFQKQPLDLLGA